MMFFKMSNRISLDLKYAIDMSVKSPETLLSYRDALKGIL